VDEEQRLIRRVQKRGDREAADALVRKYYDEIFRFVQRQIGSKDTALDVTQEVFIGFLRTIGGFDPRRASLRTWLYRVAANKLTDWFRARSRTLVAEPLDIGGAEPIDERDFTQSVTDSDFAERVSQRIGALSPDTQKIFRLHVWGERTFAEIAEITGLPESSVKSKYYRLIGRLRKEFSDYGRE
jgi:RNA polymerase sigma-70 factor (ECF subfamily)